MPKLEGTKTHDDLKVAFAGESQANRTARDEGFPEIAEWFETLAKAEKSHAGRFERAAKDLG